MGVAMSRAPRLFRPRGAAEGKRERNRRHDERRGSARSRGYGARWEAARAVFLAEHPLCLGCEAMGRVVPTVIVDHVVPHRGDEALFWDEGNWQPVCEWHHAMVKQRLEGLFDRRAITAADLRLDSRAAVDLSNRLNPP